MFFNARSWLFAITILLVAEDFQNVLKIGSNPIMEQRANSKNNICEACDEKDSEGKSEKEEEKKEEKKEKDENKNDKTDTLLNGLSRLAKIKFRDAILPLSCIAHELETPPPEV